MMTYLPIAKNDPLPSCEPDTRVIVGGTPEFAVAVGSIHEIDTPLAFLVIFLVIAGGQVILGEMLSTSI